MKRTALSVLVAGIAALGANASALGSEGSVTAKVLSHATVTGAINVVFSFDLSHCPAGQEIVLVDWQATEPSRADSGAATAGEPFGLSNGDDVQHLTSNENSSSFLAGEHWVGSGHIACGGTVIAVAGSGDTRSING